MPDQPLPTQSGIWQLLFSKHQLRTLSVSEWNNLDLVPTCHNWYPSSYEYWQSLSHFRIIWCIFTERICADNVQFWKIFTLLSTCCDLKENAPPAISHISYAGMKWNASPPHSSWFFLRFRTHSHSFSILVSVHVWICVFMQALCEL